MSRATLPPTDFWATHILRPAAAQEAARRTEADRVADEAKALDAAVKIGTPAFVEALMVEATAAVEAIQSVAGPGAARISPIMALTGEPIGLALVTQAARDSIQATVATQAPATLLVSIDIGGSRGRRHHRIVVGDEGRLAVDFDGEVLTPSEVVRHIAAPLVARVAGGVL